MANPQNIDAKKTGLYAFKEYLDKLNEEHINQALEQNQNLEQFCSFLDRKAFGWHPSSSFDLRPILVSRRKVMEHRGVQIPAAYIEPNIWILSDEASPWHYLDDKAFYCSWHHWVNGFVLHDDLTGKWGTKITFKSCRRLPLNIFSNSRCCNRHYHIELKIHCAIAGEYRVEVFFINNSNKNVVQFMQINKSIPTVFAASRAGCGDLVTKLIDGHSAQLGVKYAIANKIIGYTNCGGDLRIGSEGHETCNLWDLKKTPTLS